MARIDNLIAALCPDGVEYKKLGDISSKAKGIRWKDCPGESKRYIDLSSVDMLTHKIGELVEVDESNAPSRAKQIVRSGDLIFATTRPTQMRCCIIPDELDNQLCSTGYCVLRIKPGVVNRFVLHLLTSDDFKEYLKANQTEGNYPAISDRLLRQYEVPVPPLDVQREVVRVLDSFAELEAELEARRAQYAHYRDELLSRESLEAMAGSEVEYLRTDELFDIRGGYTPSKKKPEYWEDGTVPWFRMEDIRANGHVLSSALQAVNLSALKRDGEFPANSLIVATSATIGEHALITVPFLCNQRFSCLTPKSSYKDKVDMHFVQYYAYLLDAYCLENVNKGGFASVSMPAFKAFPFPVPSLSVQQQVVDILDRFDALTTSLTDGFPAEIEARRQQYEYYRDKLLNFPRKEVAA